MSRRPAAFLDRDGTLIQERVYLSDPEGVDLVPGTPEALKLLRSAGYALVVVTNQSGISRGYYTVEQYRAVEARLNEVLEDVGTPVDATYFCPHHPDTTGACDCRKPGTGMYTKAASELGLDLSASMFVGDKLTDVTPATVLGGTGILVRTGYGAELEPQAPREIEVVDDVLAAARWVAERASR